MTSKHLILLSVVVVGCSCWKLPAIPSGQRSQYYTQQSDGSYKFGYDSAEGLHQLQEADGANEVRGSYGLPGGTVSYVSGVGGYRLTGSNQLYTGKSSSQDQHNSHRQVNEAHDYSYPEFQNTALQYVGSNEFKFEPVTDTPEVVEAKRKFKEAYDAAAKAAAENPDPEATKLSESTNFGSYMSTSFPTAVERPSHSNVPIRYPTMEELFTLPVPVGDTPEVKKAKETFWKLYQAAAKAAEEAPDRSQMESDFSTVQSQGGSSIYYIPPNAQFTTALINSPVEWQSQWHDGGSNLPIATESHNKQTSPIRYSAVEEHFVLPVTVGDTLEVKKAKEVFFKLYEAAAKAAEETAEGPQSGSVSVYYTPPNAQFTSEPSRTNQRWQSQWQNGGASDSISGTGRYMAPLPVEDTPEVAEAKRKFKEAYDAAAKAAAENPDPEAIKLSDSTNFGSYISGNFLTATTGSSQSNVPVRYPTMEELFTLPVPVGDTPEVKKAKETFLKLYEAAAKAAQEAPEQSPSVAGSTHYNAPQSQYANLPVRPNQPWQSQWQNGGASDSISGTGWYMAPLPVEDTPEVAEAKRKFKEAYDAAAKAAAENPDPEATILSDSTNFGSYMSNLFHTAVERPSHSNVPIRYPTMEELFTLPVPVGDTPEVKKAKETFWKLYQAAAKAAEEAPDRSQRESDFSTVQSQGGSSSYFIPPHSQSTTASISAPGPWQSQWQDDDSSLSLGGTESYKAPTPVKDTEEVTAAKKAFFQHYADAAAAAESANSKPDYEQLTSSKIGSSSPYVSSYDSRVVHQRPMMNPDGYTVSSSRHRSHTDDKTDGKLQYGLDGSKVTVTWADGSSSQKYGYAFN